MKILFGSHLYGGHAYTTNAIDIVAKKLIHSVSNREGEGQSKRSGWHFQNFLISDGGGGGLELAEGYNFCNFLINTGRVVAIPKQGVGQRSASFQ